MRYAITGLNPRALSYPVLIVSIPDGHRCRVPPGFMRSIGGEKYQENLAHAADDDDDEEKD